MVEHSIVSILWRDHVHVERSPMVKNPDKEITLTLSVGILYKETKKTITLVSEVERYSDKDDVTYLIILKDAVEAVKEYGKIKLKKLQT